MNELTEVISNIDFDTVHFTPIPLILTSIFLLSKAFLLHSKTTGPEMTSKWKEICPRKDMGSEKNPCKVGIPFQEKLLGNETDIPWEEQDDKMISNAFESNCYRHSRVMNEWVPKLKVALQALPD